jgi:hypothetical protein
MSVVNGNLCTYYWLPSKTTCPVSSIEEIQIKPHTKTYQTVFNLLIYNMNNLHSTPWRAPVLKNPNKLSYKDFNNKMVIYIGLHMIENISTLVNSVEKHHCFMDIQYKKIYAELSLKEPNDFLTKLS